MCMYFLKIYLFLTGEQLLYCIMLVSAIYQYELAIGKCSLFLLNICPGVGLVDHMVVFF